MALSNSQFDMIRREYDRIRFRHAGELDERRRAVYAGIPAVKALDEEVARVSASRVRMMLTGRGGSREELKQELAEELADIALQKKVLMQEAGFPADYLEMQYTCPICKDTGFVENEKCICFKKREIDLLYDQSSLTGVLNKENFDTFSFEWYDNTTSEEGISPRENMENIYRTCLEFAQNFGRKKQNLLLTGPCGVGKTFLTHCIAKKLLDNGFSVIYLSASELFEIFSEHAFSDENDPDAELKYHHIYECDLLIIDDLGTEMVNNFTIPRLFSCLNDRERKNLPVVISTNQSLNQLRDLYSERISSRLFSNYKILNLYGDDIRIRKMLAGM